MVCAVGVKGVALCVDALDFVGFYEGREEGVYCHWGAMVGWFVGSTEPVCHGEYGCYII